MKFRELRASMQAYIRNNPRTRYLPTSGLNELAKDIAKLCQNYKPAEVLVNLSDIDLTMNFVRELIELLDKDEHLQGILALDLSLNRIQAGWEEIASVIASLLKKPLVQNLSLSWTIGLLDTECSSIQAGRLWQTGKLVSLPTGTCSGMETLGNKQKVHRQLVCLLCTHLTALFWHSNNRL